MHGEYDVYNAEKALTALLKPSFENAHVILDFTDVRYIDSTALSVLVRMRKRRQAAGYPPARLVGVKEGIKRVLQITGLDTMWPMYDTIEEAAASF